jgi:hypothetical protein
MIDGARFRLTGVTSRKGGVIALLHVIRQMNGGMFTGRAVGWTATSWDEILSRPLACGFYDDEY